MGRVTPLSILGKKWDEQQDVIIGDEEALTAPAGGAVAWVKRRWWAVALLTLLGAGALLAVIIGPICGLRGCPAKSSDTVGGTGPPRLIVQFTLPEIDALDLLPALLRNYTTRLNLTTSLLQILDFVDEATLQEASKYLLQSQDLALLTRDFVMGYRPGGVNNLDINNIASFIDNGVLQAAGIPLGAVALNSSNSRLSTVDLSTVPWRRRRRALRQTTVAGGPDVNDPFILNGTQWHHARIKSDIAWATSEGDASVVVAVIDAGFDLTHPDLLKQLWVNTGEAPAQDGIDNDGNGYVDDLHGYDFNGGCKPQSGGGCTCVPRPDPWPVAAAPNAHGTHVAGLIAATADNAMGGAGSAPNVKLMLLGAADCNSGEVLAANVFKALDYAVKKGAHMVSMSIGALWNANDNPRSPAPPDAQRQYQQWQQAYIAAIKPLADRNMLVVTAAGNEAVDLDNVVAMGYTYLPCVVPLDNVLCVGATDLNDSLANYTNYGASQVDIMAPGDGILSTLWAPGGQHLYGQLTGSSMSTPIVAGVAALVASVLGARDRNFTHATKIKALLMNSGDPQAGLQTVSVSGKRVNAAAAVVLAMGSLTDSSYIPRLPPISTPTNPPGVMRVSGLKQAYWTNTNPMVLDTSGQTQIDESIHGGAPLFTPLKYTGAGVMVNATAALLVNSSGLHTFTLTYPSTYLGGRIQVNDVALGMTTGPTSATAAFQAQAAGWYKVSFAFLPVDHSLGAVRVLLTPPGASQPGLYPGSYQAYSTVSYTPPPLTNQYSDPSSGTWGLNNAWWVFLNTSAPVNFTQDSASWLYSKIKISSSSVWQTQLAADMDSLNLPALFRAAVAPTDSPTSEMTVMGYATTTWPTADVPALIAFQVLCKGCSVLMNGQVVLDSFAGFNGPPTFKTSTCITIVPGTNYTLTIKFATKLLASNDQNRMVLQYMPCGGLNTRDLKSLSTNSLTPAVIDMTTPVAPSSIGWIGGVQCDVWQSTAGASTVPATAPLFKVRLPLCPNPEIGSSSCSTPWSFTLNSIIQGANLAATTPPGVAYSVRCWAYTNSSAALPGGMQLSTSPTQVYSSVWVGGVQRYRATPAAVTLRSTLPTTTLYSTAAHQVLQQVLVDWVGVAPSQLLSVLVGSVVATPVNINLHDFMLPLWTVGQGRGLPSQIIDPLTGSKPIGNPGVYVQAYLPTDKDVTGTVSINPQQVGALSGTFTSSTLGLSGMVKPSGASLTNKVWYAVVDGYYWAILGGDANAGWATLQFSEPAGAATMVLAGDVVLRNAPAYSPNSAAVPRVSVDVYLPWAYLHMTVITKLIDATGGITYNWQVSPSGGATSDLDASAWYRTSIQPHT